MSPNAGPPPVPLEHIFVYGTLKRGECRETCWPMPALRIEPAWIFGRLIDLGPYPALLIGDDRVIGELWTFLAIDIAGVFKELDRVEQTNQPGLTNEYDRVRVMANIQRGGEVEASTYRYATPWQADQHTMINATLLIDGQRYARWPR